MTPTPHDRQVFGRALTASLLMQIVALVVMAQTDEATSTWADRGARLCALTPALGAFSVALLRQQQQRRGEALALALSGASPLRLAAAAAVGGALPGLAGALFLGLAGPPLRALLPTVAASPWRPAGAGFVAPALGLALEAPGGAVSFGAASAVAAPEPRSWVALAIGSGALLACWWAGLPAPGAGRAAVGGGAVLGAIVAFHAVAAGKHPALLLLPAALLAAHAAWLTARGLRDLRGRWTRSEAHGQAAPRHPGASSCTAARATCPRRSARRTRRGAGWRQRWEHACWSRAAAPSTRCSGLSRCSRTTRSTTPARGRASTRTASCGWMRRSWMAPRWRAAGSAPCRRFSTRSPWRARCCATAGTCSTRRRGRRASRSVGV